MSRPDRPEDAFKVTTAAALRALAGETPDHLDVTFGPTPASFISGQQRVIPGANQRRTARLPQPLHGLSAEAKAELRGAADAAALYLKYHDAQKHADLAPPDPKSRAVFDMLEQVRCDMAGARDMQGVAQNLAAALDSQARRKGYGNADKPVPVPLEDGVFALAYEAMSGRPLGPAAHNAALQWRDHVLGRLGDEGFDGLKYYLHDQRAFAAAAYRLIRALDLNPGRGDPDDTAQEEAPAKGTQGAEPREDESGEGAGEGAASETAQDEGQQGEAGAEPGDAGDELQSPDGAGERPAAMKQNPADGPPGRNESYAVYNKQHDEIIEAASLAKPDELHRLRASLDQQLLPLQAVIGRLANRLLRRLMAKQQRSWLFDVEEGQLDPARLARVVTNPGSPLSFKIEKDTDFRDTVVTLLIDNSGSMRGRPITMAALTADILSRALERCGIKVEILGFTTAAWKGGKSRDDWMAAGKPQHPGRLNDIRHIIYKGADQPLRRARVNLGLMLKEGILKENIDGEALLWAHARLLKRPEKRRILMVISDGAPVDDSTLSANGSAYLENDLKRIIDWIEDRDIVELVAIGIGHDVTRYYRHAVTIRDVDDLARTVADQLADLFALN